MQNETQGRARIGVLIPSSNTVMEQDLIRGLLDVADVYAARMYLVETTEAAESEMLDRYFPQALIDIASVRPDVTVFGCTSAGALRGPDYDAQMCKRIEDATAGEAVSTIASVSRAVTATGRSRISVLTPYVDDLNARIRSSLEASDLQVVAIDGFGIDDNFELATPTPEEITERATALVRRSRPELLFISCTNFRAREARKAIEESTGVPVVTSNSAVMEAVRRRLGVVTVATRTLAE
jgi:maleate isomerase